MSKLRQKQKLVLELSDSLVDIIENAEADYLIIIAQFFIKDCANEEDCVTCNGLSKLIERLNNLK